MSIARDIAAWLNATATKKGPVELATQAEVDAGTDSSRVITADTLRNAVSIPEAYTAIKTADTSRANTVTLAADPHLTISGLPQGTYAVEVHMNYQGAIAADIKVNLLAGGFWLRPNVVASVNPEWIYSSFATALLNIGLAATPMFANFNGYAPIFGGSFTLQWAQQTSNATATTLSTGSWLKLTRVA